MDQGALVNTTPYRMKISLFQLGGSFYMMVDSLMLFLKSNMLKIEILSY